MSGPTPPIKKPAGPRKSGRANSPDQARSRKAEAVFSGAGDGGEDLDASSVELDEKPLHAEFGPLEASGRSIRDRVAQWIAIRTMEPGISNIEVARRLGLTEAGLNSILSRARRRGILQTEDPLTKIELDLIPKAVENLEEFLNAKDKKVTIEFAKGVLFPTYKEARGIKDNQTTILGIKIEMPENDTPQRRGSIAGTPRIFAASSAVSKNDTAE